MKWKLTLAVLRQFRDARHRRRSDRTRGVAGLRCRVVGLASADTRLVSRSFLVSDSFWLTF
jgi:hypothetical protein